MKLTSHREIIFGEVIGLSQGIAVSNAKPDEAGLATVNPIFTWVEFAQRVPMRTRITHVPEGTRLVAGLTATVRLEPRSAK